MNLVDRLKANTTWDRSSGCRIWTGSLVRGQGVMKIGGQIKRVHRVTWELERGKIPEGLWVLHSCGLSACCNVDHLRLGDQAENARASDVGGAPAVRRKASSPARKTMAVPRAELTQDDVRRALDYDAQTGVMTWRTRADRDHSWNMRFANEVAGNTMGHGYRCINILGKLHLVHRLAWLWMTGEWPPGNIDHINRDRADNRWCNLRLASASQNAMNSGLREANTSGVKGVSWSKSKRRWIAFITLNGKRRHLGSSTMIEEAKRIREAAEAEHFGEYAHKGVA
jgi:hypothetical protein